MTQYQEYQPELLDTASVMQTAIEVPREYITDQTDGLIVDSLGNFWIDVE